MNVALPSIRRGLDLTPARLSWAIDGYLVAFAVLQTSDEDFETRP